MAKVLTANNAAGTLAGSIGPSATTINLDAGQGALFPAPAAGQYFVGTLRPADESSLLNEIVHVTNVTGDTLTVVRAQEGTTGLSWAAGDAFLNLFTSGTFDILIQEKDLQDESTNYAVDTGSANAYLAAFDPAVTAYVVGSPLRVKIGNTNTNASCTLDAGAGAVAIKTGAGNNPTVGSIVAGTILTFIFDGTYFQIQPATGAVVTFIRTIRYTASATYNRPAGLLYADVTVYGPGGGGGGVKLGSAAEVCGGGGGSGGSARAVLTAAQIGASQAMTVPAAGTGGTNTGGNGAPGAGSTSFGSLVVAGPGGGGGGNTTAYARGQPGSAGVPSAGDFLHYGIAGGSGHAAPSVGIGGCGGGFGGGPGTGFEGGGMAGINASGVLGGGGSGACANTTTGFAGGNGAPGSIEIVEYYG